MHIILESATSDLVWKTAIIIIIIITIIIIGFYTERKIVADGTTWDIILGSQLVGAEDLLQAQGA